MSSSRPRGQPLPFSNVRPRLFRKHTARITRLAWSCDGDLLASGSSDKDILIWTLRTIAGTPTPAAPKRAFRGHTDTVECVTWNPKDANELLSCASDGTARLWDVRTDAPCVRSMHTVGKSNINAAWHPDGVFVGVGNDNDVFELWDVRMNARSVERRFDVTVDQFSWNKSGDLLYITTQRGDVEVYHFPSMQLALTIPAHADKLCCFQFDPSFRYFAVGSADAIVSLWDAQEYICLRTFSRLDWRIRSISFSADSKIIASASENETIDVSDTETGDLIHSVDCKFAVNCVAWHPKELILAYVGEDKESLLYALVSQSVRLP